ncbi:Uncharacterised protein [Yersinia mollaretii]|uniref:Uncharacterized protein n=1 Tax=Yersinia mollaretii TaxID=33060 RepID=A0AA36PME2_YERMO|nr:Uncharacterised protein [Yersinia mollaretii]CNH28700.1 Uncharacterised protein [Yersinia mollaretii]CQJ13722.1 Uncharacterised protein [Yersinia mollaretii]
MRIQQMYICPHRELSNKNLKILLTIQFAMKAMLFSADENDLYPSRCFI